MEQIFLQEGWRLREEPLSMQRESVGAVLAQEQGWMDCSLPCDVSMALMAHGRIADPVVAMHCYENEWIERRSWWFVKEFSWAEAARYDAVELVFPSLDCHADVFLNGAYLGHQASAHYPFRREVSRHLRSGVNRIVVRLTVGLEYVSDGDLAQIDRAVCTERGNGRTDRSDKRRAFLRKPQYVFGWDWSPRIATCGIMEVAYLELHRKVAVRALHIATQKLADGQAWLRGEIVVENLDMLGTLDADARLSLCLKGETIRAIEWRDQWLASGFQHLPFEARIPHPRLWWPNGYGEQPLYEAKCTVSVAGEVLAERNESFGIRTVELDTSRDETGWRRFAFRINGREIFCKGANWIPADAIYARVDDARFATLLREAKEANFNMLRVWGGGLYNREIFYRLCDELGILLWHDFMFGCACYPDHLEAFRLECEREMEFQTRRLRNHPCMALFCGNNENHQIFDWQANPGWGIHPGLDKQYGLLLANRCAREAVWRNCPEIPYWNSSPYGGARPGEEDEGDVHYWSQCMMNPDMQKRIEPREYERVHARFVSEYGYPGPTCLATMREYLGQEAIDRNSEAWKLHTNTFEKDTVAAGIAKHYGDPEGLSLEEYILYAGMVQSTMLEESLETLRAKLFCAGSLFWMYNDCWGEVGWSIVDYALRRKIAYYGVRRAFAPVRLILRKVGEMAIIVGCNDAPEPTFLEGMLGYVALDGADARQRRVRFEIPAGRSIVLREALPQYDVRRGVFAFLPDAPEADAAVLRRTDIRQMEIAGQAQIEECQAVGEDLAVVVRASRYTHGVYFAGDMPCSEEYFDLLPGQRKRVILYGCAGKTPVLRWVR